MGCKDCECKDRMTALETRVAEVIEDNAKLAAFCLKQHGELSQHREMIGAMNAAMAEIEDNGDWEYEVNRLKEQLQVLMTFAQKTGNDVNAIVRRLDRDGV